MEKIKVDLIIKGSLVCKYISGGGIFQSPESDLNKYFDCEGAIQIDGDVNTERLDSHNRNIVVCGEVVALEEGGNDALH